MNRYLTIIIIVLGYVNIAEAQITGKVLDPKEKPVSRASIIVLSNHVVTYTDVGGQFTIDVDNLPDTLLIRYIGYKDVKIPITSPKEVINVQLSDNEYVIDDVVISTGYQRIPRERATGSFSYLDNRTINRVVSTDIVSRLEGVVNSLSYELPRTPFAPSTTPQIRVRGLSTINGEASPLIVVDGFPYEGDINLLNPNDVQDITVLKDAAAASIWGARAGNGVIVITTKSGLESARPRFTLNSNVSIDNRPDLYYAPYMLPSAAMVELEQLLFAKGLYTKNNWTALSPVIETLFAEEEGSIDAETAYQRLESFKQYDIRSEAKKWLYRPSIKQQYVGNIVGGGEKYRYYISSGVDRNRLNLVGDEYERFTLFSNNDFRLNDRLMFNMRINITHAKNTDNGISITDLNPVGMGRIYTYARLADESGNVLPLIRNNRMTYTENAVEMGLLDWQYRPLEELNINDNSNKTREARINTGASYKINDHINAEVRYQYQHINNHSRNYYSTDSYFARHLINQYTQVNGDRPIPLGGILDRSSNNFVSHYGRAQLNLKKSWGEKHEVYGLGGFELRQEQGVGGGATRLYGYNDEVLSFANNVDYKNSYVLRPNSSGRVPYNTSPGAQIVDRFVSYYGNFSYTYGGKYIATGSLRRDASNIFGVDFNQKGVPLWSAGLAWNVSDESLFDFAWLDQAKFRLTYGSNGNAVRTLSSLPHVQFGYANSASGVSAARLRSVGNPDLSWEKVSTFNLGLDFSLLRNRITGSIEWYDKHSANLIGYDFIDPTTGIIGIGTAFNLDNRRNYADMMAQGLDLELHTRNVNGRVSWGSTFMFSHIKNRITNYYTNPTISIADYFSQYMVPPVEGLSKDQMFALPWHGLDSEGNPLVMVNNTLGTDYNAYFNGLKVDDLVRSGSSVPTYFGSFMNTLTWRGLSMSANLLWKAGYKIRRESISYSNLYGQGRGTHIDYLNRWKQSGDEEATQVPALPERADLRRDQVYLFSEALIEKGDHIRLQDISLSYRLPDYLIEKHGLAEVRIFGYARNIGVIWKHTNQNIDPDVRALYPLPLQVAFGLQIQF